MSEQSSFVISGGHRWASGFYFVSALFLRRVTLRMKTQPVIVIDGPLPPGIWERPDMEPQLVTAPEDMAVRDELMQREPLFHRPAYGATREDFEKMTAPEFWEVGASSRRYSREFVDGSTVKFRIMSNGAPYTVPI
jgi:hypothetical protein